MAKKARDSKNGPVVSEKKEFEEELLDLARVTRVVRGGRRLRFRATVVVGNKKGKVGIGTGKSAEVAVAVQKAVTDAKKRLIQVPLTEGLSIPHDVTMKFKAARLLIMPASEGTGVKAGGVLRKILDLAGVHNIIAKRFGSTSPLVNAQATIQALSLLKKAKKGGLVIKTEENSSENLATSDKE